MRLNAALGLIRAAALSAALFLLGSLLPVFGPVLMLCAPAPLLISALRQPRPEWRIAGLLALCLAMVGLIAGIWPTIAFASSFGLATAVMFVMLRRQCSFELVVVAVTAAVSVATFAALLVWAGSPAALATEIHHSLAATTSHADAFYHKLGLSLADSKELNARVLAITAQLVPGLVAVVAAAMALINLALAWRWLGRQGLGYPLFNTLTKWRTPEWVIWLLLLTGFGLFVPLRPLRVAAGNGFLLVTAVYFCQGLAIMAYYFQMLAMPSLARGLIYLITVIQPILAALVCLAGIFDMWIDFRRLKPPKEEAGSLDDFL